MASVLHIPGGIHWSSLGVIFMYYTQFLVYDRVNFLQLIMEKGVSMHSFLTIKRLEELYLYVRSSYVETLLKEISDTLR